MNRKPDTAQQWNAERDYILSVDPFAPDRNYLYSRTCFARYCAMQAKFARADGFTRIAAELEEVREAALRDLEEERTE